MNKNTIIETLDKVEDFLSGETPERQTELINILVACWGLSQEGLGYVVGRLVGSRKKNAGADLDGVTNGADQ